MTATMTATTVATTTTHDSPHGHHGGGRMTRLRQSRLGASLDGHRRRHELASVEAFCIFIGYPRSGHSLLGSLLDAHPEMVIAHELDVLTFVAAGWPRRALYSRILNHDATFTESGRQWFGYDYRVPGQWQGRVSKLRVIGDKKGGKTTERLGARPDLLERLRRTVEVPVRLVHVVRSPYDNITTMARRSGQTLEQAARALLRPLCHGGAGEAGGARDRRARRAARGLRRRPARPSRPRLPVPRRRPPSDRVSRRMHGRGLLLTSPDAAPISRGARRSSITWPRQAAGYDFLNGYSYAEEQQPT